MRVDELVPGLVHPPIGTAQEQERGDACELVVVRGEHRADVAEIRRAEQRVNERVGHDVAVRVPREPGLVGELDAAEDERHARVEPVRVDAQPDSHPSGTSRALRWSKTVTVS